MFETEYAQAEHKIVFTDKPNLNKIPPTPVNSISEPQYSRVYSNLPQINVKNRQNEEMEMPAKRRVKRV